MHRVMLKIQRRAIAMIELIFAIVIIGIVMLSIPNLISISAQSGYTSLQQEAIATAATQLNIFMTKHWDENNTGITGAPILDTTHGTPSLARAGRAGIVPGLGSRAIIDSTGTALSSNVVFNDFNDTFDDIDDADGTVMTLRDYNNTTVSAGDTIDRNITLATSVTYILDATSTVPDYNTHDTIQYNIGANALANTSTNIKLISTRLTTTNIATELAKNITLQAFTCNIGTYSPQKRDLP